MSDYRSLITALEGHLDKKLDELPDEARELVESDFSVELWNKLSPDQRRSLAIQLDSDAPNPGSTLEIEARTEFFNNKRALELQIAEWESKSAPTANDMTIKEARLVELRQKLAEMEKIVARGDFLDPVEPNITSKHVKPPGHLNHDQELQAMANQIAEELKIKPGRSATKEKVAKILAEKKGMDDATVLRRIRKQWK
jgi:hypothetical protein